MFKAVLERYNDEAKRGRRLAIYSMVHSRGTDGRHTKTFRALLKHQCRMMIATSIPSTKHKIPTSVVAGAKAAAEATRRVETTAENFMVDQVIVYMRIAKYDL
jgi:hypothetical protein